MKREGASTLFIHGYPWALSYLFRSLSLLFNCLKWCFVCGFERCFEKRPCLGNLCNDSCLNIYKGVCLFLKRYFNV